VTPFNSFYDYFTFYILFGVKMKSFNDIFMVEGIGYDCNVYIFDDVMIDTGTGQNIGYLLKNLEEEGFLEDLSMIINTHCHYDHVGGNIHFNKKIAIHIDDAYALENGDNTATLAYMFGKSIEKIKIDIYLSEGDKIHGFEVIHTPGHTAGGICLYDGENLISGDTVFANGGFGRLDVGGDINMMKESLKRLKNLDIEYLLPGHGPCTDNGSEHVKLAYENAKIFDYF
jgi:hydroxyacylglutathione hydrolase